MKKLYRDRWDKKIGGVCGGIAQFLEIDPTIIRLLMGLISVPSLGLPLIVIYLICWMLIPLGPPTYVHYECKRIYRSMRERKIGGICGGISDLFKMDPTMIRILVVALAVLTGLIPIGVTYIIGILIIPENPEDE